MKKLDILKFKYLSVNGGRARSLVLRASSECRRKSIKVIMCANPYIPPILLTICQNPRKIQTADFLH